MLRILYVGVLSEAKGVAVLVEACGKLAARGVPFEVELMGQWESEEFAAKVDNRIQELNLDRHFTFLGVQFGEDKESVVPRAELFCFPTHFECETFGLGLLEAMSFGLPVVASIGAAYPRIVDEGETGFLFEAFDEDALADRLARLAETIATYANAWGRRGGPSSNANLLFRGMPVACAARCLRRPVWLSKPSPK